MESLTRVSGETVMGLWGDLKDDVCRYPGDGRTRVKLALCSQGFWAVATYRLGHALYGCRRMPRALKVARLLWRVPSTFVECVTGIQIPPSARIGPGLYIGHFGGVIVSGHAVIGARCNLSQGVTIGVSNKGTQRGCPVIGDRVYVAPGAKVFGPIDVGSDAAIGANAVVVDDVPAGVTVGGIPAKLLSPKGSRALIELGDEAAA